VAASLDRPLFGDLSPKGGGRTQFCEDEQCRSGAGKIFFSTSPQTAKGHGQRSRCLRMTLLIVLPKKRLGLRASAVGEGGVRSLLGASSTSEGRGRLDRGLPRGQPPQLSEGVPFADRRIS